MLRKANDLYLLLEVKKQVQIATSDETGDSSRLRARTVKYHTASVTPQIRFKNVSLTSFHSTSKKLLSDKPKNLTEVPPSTGSPAPECTPKPSLKGTIKVKLRFGGKLAGVAKLPARRGRPPLLAKPVVLNSNNKVPRKSPKPSFSALYSKCSFTKCNKEKVKSRQRSGSSSSSEVKYTLAHDLSKKKCKLVDRVRNEKSATSKSTKVCAVLHLPSSNLVPTVSAGLQSSLSSVRAKQLVAKARTGQALKVGMARYQGLIWTGLYCPERFQLPTQSVRSSRKITINKRFVDDGYCTIQQKKPKLEVDASLDVPADIVPPVPIRRRRGRKPKLVTMAESSSNENVLLPAVIPAKTNDIWDVPEKKIGLLDLPLVCDNKRSHKPSEKIIRFWSEDYEESAPKARHSAASDEKKTYIGEEGEVQSEDIKMSAPCHHGHVKLPIKRSVKAAKLKANLDLSVGPTDHLSVSGETGSKRKHNTDVSELTSPDISDSEEFKERVERNVAGSKNRCCICCDNYLVNHHFLCRKLCCRRCASFFKTRSISMLANNFRLVCKDKGIY